MSNPVPNSEDIAALQKQMEELRAQLVMTQTKPSLSNISKLQEQVEQAKRKAAITKNEIAELDIVARQLKERIKMVDICFLMDCTGTMTPFISAAKAQITKILDAATFKFEGNTEMRVAFVGYRDHDYPQAQRIQVMDFKRKADAQTLKDFVNSMSAINGNDPIEDVAGGLKAATTLNWKAVTRVLIHIGDAPCHGREFHSEKQSDLFPNGCECGNPLKYVREFAEHKVDYYFSRINDTTDIMMKSFEEEYKGFQSQIKSKNLTTDPQEFLDFVVSSVTASRVRSLDRADFENLGSSNVVKSSVAGFQNEKLVHVK